MAEGDHKAGQVKGAGGRTRRTTGTGSTTAAGTSRLDQRAEDRGSAEPPAARLAARSRQSGNNCLGYEVAKWKCPPSSAVQVLARLEEATSFADLDWQAVVNRIAELKTSMRS